MNLQTLLSGVVIGFSIAAPVGPIGVLCIQRTLNQGRRYGLISGLGAATADAFYMSIAAFGLAVVSDLLIQHQMWLRIVGGVFLCFLSFRTFLRKPQEKTDNEKVTRLATSYVSTFFLTLTNPITILSFVGVFASLGLGSTFVDSGSAASLVVTVFAGSAVWWLVLSSTVSLLKAKLTPRVLLWINRFSGIIILAFGLIAITGITLL